MRLIDADALKKALEKLKDETLEYEENLDDVDAIIDAAPTIQFLLKAEPTAEQVKELKGLLAMPQNFTIVPMETKPKGRWLEEGVPDWTGYQCDRCGGRALEIDGVEIRSKFCPHCGADMRKEAKSDN